MNFLKLLLRGIALLPSIIQGTEALFGAGDRRAEEGCGADCGDGRDQCGGCGDAEADCGWRGVYGGVEHSDRWGGGLFECEHLAQGVGAECRG